MKRRPPPTPAQHMGGHCLTDAKLCEMLLAKAPLTAADTEAYVAFSLQLTTGQLVRLPKVARDHGMALAKANGLLAKTSYKPSPNPGATIGFGDGFSTVPGPVHPQAAKQLGKIPAPIRKAG